MSTNQSPEITVAMIPQPTSKLLEAEDQVKAIHQEAVALAISSDSDALTGADLLNRIKAAVAEIDKERMRWTRPLDERKAEIKGEFDSRLSNPLRETQLILEKKILDYHAAIKAAQEKVNAAKRKEWEDQAYADMSAGKETAPLPMKIDKAPDKIITDAGSAKVVQEWTWELVDFSKVSDDYKIINGTLLNSVARTKKVHAAVPGIRFFAQDKLATRRATGIR